MSLSTTSRNQANSTDHQLHGWVGQPDTRGTIDILWACGSTIFICVWVMLHLNVPAEKDTQVTLWLRRLRWFVLALLAPELVMLFAGGQWASAKRSVSSMRARGFRKWSMIHAFYADSGGFVLQPGGSAAFPITAAQVQYLVEKEHIPLPSLTKKEIWDKSKADAFAKTVAALQSAWFTLQIVARGIQHLPVTLLELSTICLMTCTAASLFFWFFKPLNVETPTVLCTEATTAEMISTAGDKGSPTWEATPLDFIEPLAYTSTKMPFSTWWSVQERPLPRLPNDRDSQLHNWQVVAIISVPTAAFGTLQLIAWNFVFPTQAEQMLWRYTCLGNGIVLGVGCALEAGAIIFSKFTVAGLDTFNQYKLRWPWSLLFFIPGAMYFVARTIVIVEVLISLRALPVGCFSNVNWTGFLPHI
ncbi:MAG: hypothetical protein M1828_003211 [Chrysothrix sp. TS-e1954]|nr:MAG: hypothetical protein M1828_003211 [Chrysothrix sp. TS-e1954]